MPYRRIPLITGEIYHVLNRSIARQPIFLTEKDYHRALDILEFYSYERPILRFSHYNRLQAKQKSEFLINLKNKGKRQVDILAFCLMPNHFHLLMKEIQLGGISTFMRNFQNSYAKYFNLKSERTGAVFQSMFKAVRIETDEQLVHVCRYIHLNPLTSFILKDSKELESYFWSSYPFYLEKARNRTVTTGLILSLFSSLQQFTDFHLNQIDYQRRLEEIKHLALE
ncbi:transposase [Candidatus Daviesbacteria bacterium]|nr:transposase [Candidatus Daviesbacteria bacterium]